MLLGLRDKGQRHSMRALAQNEMNEFAVMWYQT
jgi:hypothetical protein